MKNLIWFLAILFLLALAVIVPTFIFLGVAYVLSIILPLSLFESAVLAIGSSFVLAFSIAAVSIIQQISKNSLFFPQDDQKEEFYEDEFYEDEEDDDDDDFEEEDKKGNYDEYEHKNVLTLHRVPQNTVKIGRNAPCPCGSGLKYKRCCGKNV